MVSRFIILGLLISKPRTGYDLKTFFKKSINFFWSAELSQIYRELSKLEREGYVQYKTEPGEGRPDKKIYSATEKGEEAFLQWLNNFPQTLSSTSRNEFLVRIFFSSQISSEDLIFQLKRYIREQVEELKTYHTIEENVNAIMEQKDSPKGIFYQRLALRRGIHICSADIEWAKQCIEEIKNKRQNE